MTSGRTSAQGVAKTLKGVQEVITLLINEMDAKKAATRGMPWGA